MPTDNTPDDNTGDDFDPFEFEREMSGAAKKEWCSREPTLDECEAAFRDVARGDSGHSLIELLELGYDGAERGEENGHTWITAIQRARTAGVLTTDEAELFIATVAERLFADSLFHTDPEQDALAERIHALEDSYYSWDAGDSAEMWTVPDGWTELNAAYVARFTDMRRTGYADMGERELGERLTRSWFDECAKFERTRDALIARSGGPPYQIVSGHPFPYTRFAGHELLDIWYYDIMRRATAPECLFLIESAVSGRGGSSMGDRIDHLDSESDRSPVQARRWIAAGQRARELGMITKQDSWALIIAAYDGWYFNRALDDPVASALASELHALEERYRHGTNDEVDWMEVKPPEWQVLDDRWARRLSDIRHEFLVRIGEPELAAFTLSIKDERELDGRLDAFRDELCAKGARPVGSA